MNVRTFAVFLAALLGMNTAVQSAPPPVVDGGVLTSLAPMLDEVTPAVVNIATEGRVVVQSPLLADPFFRRFFNVPDQPVERKTQSLGSGVIVDAARGLVLTNNHVIANAVQVTVTLRDGRHMEAEIVGSDPETDVAVIKIPAADLTAVARSDSDKLRVGDFVAAIGNPFGLGQSVTYGIVSGLSRSGLGIEGYEDFIQTDASINPGNSGGALVNLRGELVGINTAILSQTGGSIGIGLAIPINLALHIMDQLVEKGEVERGFVGVQVQDLSPELAEAFNIKDQSGAIVNSVMEGSPAAAAGLLPGDIITAMNGKPVQNAGDVRNQIGLLPVGQSISFEILRDGARKTLKAKVIAGKESGSGPTAVNPRLEGLSIGDIGKDHPFYGRLKGVVVEGVQRGSLPWRSGLRQGDIITSVNHTDITVLEDFLKAVDKKQEPLLLRVVRGNAAAFLVIR